LVVATFHFEVAVLIIIIITNTAAVSGSMTSLGCKLTSEVPCTMEVTANVIYIVINDAVVQGDEAVADLYKSTIISRC
jgi:hypothetical protein